MAREEKKSTVEYYLGTVVEVLDRALYEIKVDIPGEFDGVKAFPVRGEIDEPKVGDFVLLRSFDPVYHSYFLYQKLKENDFIGFRSMGKMIEVEPNGKYIRIATFDIDEEFTDGEQGANYKPKPTNWVKISDGGKMDIFMESNVTARIKGNGKAVIDGNTEVEVFGNSEVTVHGNVTITVDGDSDIVVNGSTTIQSPDVSIKGPGMLTCKGQTKPDPAGGPFCAFSVAPPPGTPLVSGYQVVLE